jgi:hypothetical protein
LIGGNLPEGVTRGHRVVNLLCLGVISAGHLTKDEAGDGEPSDDEHADALDETAAGLVVLNEGINPVLQAQTSAGKAIAALLDMVNGEHKAEALEALAAIAEQVTAAINTATAPKVENVAA